jgi:hypothetical protein
MDKGYKRIRAKWSNGDGKFETSWSIKWIIESFNRKYEAQYTIEDLSDYFFTRYDVLHCEMKDGKQMMFPGNCGGADKRADRCWAVKY